MHRRGDIILKPDVWEKGSEGLESANRLNILYQFEDKIFATNAFKETLKLIDEKEEFQNHLEWILDNYNEQDDPLQKHAFAFITIHITRLGIPYTDDDLYRCVLMLHALFEIKDEEMGGLLSRIISKR